MVVLTAVLSVAVILATSNYEGLIHPIVRLGYGGSGWINSSVIGGSNFAKSIYDGLILSLVSLRYGGSFGINSSVIDGSNIVHIKL